MSQKDKKEARCFLKFDENGNLIFAEGTFEEMYKLAKKISRSILKGEKDENEKNS